MITDLTRLKDTKIRFIKTVQTQYTGREIIAVHLTGCGKKFSERYKYDFGISAVNNHLLCCLRLTETRLMKKHYGYVLSPESYQQNKSTGFTFNLIG